MNGCCRSEKYLIKFSAISNFKHHCCVNTEQVFAIDFDVTQPIFICSKSAIKTEKCSKYFRINNNDTRLRQSSQVVLILVYNI